MHLVTYWRAGVPMYVTSLFERLIGTKGLR